MSIWPKAPPQLKWYHFIFARIFGVNTIYPVHELGEFWHMVWYRGRCYMLAIYKMEDKGEG